MRHFMAQFGPALQWPWTRLTDVPELTDELLDRLVAQSDEQAGGPLDPGARGAARRLPGGGDAGTPRRRVRRRRGRRRLRADRLAAALRGGRVRAIGAQRHDGRRHAPSSRASGSATTARAASVCTRRPTERVLDTFALDPDVGPVTVKAGADVAVGRLGRRPSQRVPDGCGACRRSAASAELPAPRLWDAEIAAALPEFEYAEVVSGDDGAAAVRRGRVDDGHRVRAQRADDRGDVARPRPPGRSRSATTNFGADFHVEAKLDPNNVAYTAVELRPHTDLPYHGTRRASSSSIASPPTRRAARARSSTGSGSPTGSAATIRTRSGVLCDVPIPYRFHDAGHDLRFAAPVIGCEPRRRRYREIRFHNALMAPFDLAVGMTEATYRALRRFDRVARSDEAQLVVRLQPGDVIVFHNRRVLHGRRAFDPGAGGSSTSSACTSTSTNGCRKSGCCGRSRPG